LVVDLRSQRWALQRPTWNIISEYVGYSQQIHRYIKLWIHWPTNIRVSMNQT
jgi:hypothetical protein